MGQSRMRKGEGYGWYAGGLLLCALMLTAQAGRLPLPVSAALWCGLIAVAVRWAPQIRVPARGALRGSVLAYAFIGAVCYLTLRYLIGVFMGSLAASPYDHRPAGILVNLLRVLPPLIGRELVRGYTFGAAWRGCKHRGAALVLLTLLLFAADLHPARILGLEGMQATVIYTAQTIAPALARDILLSVLVFYGGAAAGVLYAAIPVAFEWLFPFLPSLPWLAQGAVGVSFPLILAVIVSDRFRSQKRGDPVRGKKETVGFVITLAASVLFAWFVVGVFPLYPSVVLTGSMQPMIHPGDVVLIRKLHSEAELNRLGEGDVINFRRGEIVITHRIIGVLRDEAGNLSFQTKGDNNDAADTEPVQPGDVKGTVRQVVPKVGLPVVILKSGAPMPEGVVDDG